MMVLGKNPTLVFQTDFQWPEDVMLVLKRRKGEAIIVNERLRIEVIDTGCGSCRLAFHGPESDRIRREELPPRVEDMVQKTASAIGLPK
jgi:carbon storage regulator CsrA